jgi:threonyl-tRNA synthetase
MFYFHRGVSSNDFPELERIMKKGSNEKQPFERLEISKEDLIRLFGVSRIIDPFSWPLGICGTGGGIFDLAFRFEINASR